MRCAFVIFNGMTALDFIGVYDPVGRLQTMGFLPDFHWETVSLTPDVQDDRGLRIVPSVVQIPLTGFDLVVVPGGRETRKLQHEGEFIGWLATAQNANLVTSVCTGALLLGAAGYLTGRAATTHWSAYDELRHYTTDVRTDRVVDAGAVITGGGVTAAIDVGLHIVRRIAGADVQLQITRQMAYPGLMSPLAVQPSV